MDRITRLRIFSLVAETLSFTKTASAMGLARSSVKKAVNQLEVELGVRLLDRTTRTVELTLEGAMFRDRCQEVLASFDDVHTMFGGEAAKARGLVRASVPSRMGRRLIVPALPTFFERYADVELELRVSHRQDDLLREGLDCVLQVGDKADSDFIARKVADTPLVLCARPSYIARHGEPQSVADLSLHRLVGYHPPFPGLPDTADSALLKENPFSRMRRPMTVTNVDMFIAACEAGLGLAVLPRIDIDDLLRTGVLVEILPGTSLGRVPIAVVYAHRLSLAPRVEAFIDWIADIVRHAAVAEC